MFNVLRVFFIVLLNITETSETSKYFVANSEISWLVSKTLFIFAGAVIPIFPMKRLVILIFLIGIFPLCEYARGIYIEEAADTLRADALTAYESLEKDIASVDFSLSACMNFLNEYKDSEYSDKVSDLISLYYLSILSPSSPDFCFETALNYAKSEDVIGKVTQKRRELKNMSKKSRRRHIWAGRFLIGFGAEYGMWRSSVVGGKMEARIGRIDDLLNVAAGTGVLFWNADWSRGRRYAYMRFCQYPFYVSAKLNTFRFKSSRLYFGVEAAYNLPDSFYEYVRTDRYHKLILSDITVNYFTLTGKIGLYLPSVDINLFVAYDTKSPFDRQLLLESSPEEYYAMGPAVDDKFRIGLNIMIYFTL